MSGKPEGVGVYTYHNGEIYDGQWVNGMKHGSGIWRGSKNDSYIGEWKFGKPDGYGVHTWVNGKNLSNISATLQRDNYSLDWCRRSI